MLMRENGLAGLGAPVFHLAIEQKYLSSRDTRAGVPRADRHAPSDGRATGGEFVDDAGFAPHAIALWAEPLGPVIGAGCCREGEEDRKTGND